MKRDMVGITGAESEERVFLSLQSETIYVV